MQRFDFHFERADEGLRYKYDLTLNLAGTAICSVGLR